MLNKPYVFRRSLGNSFLGKITQIIGLGLETLITLKFVILKICCFLKFSLFHFEYQIIKIWKESVEAKYIVIKLNKAELHTHLTKIRLIDNRFLKKLLI